MTKIPTLDEITERIVSEVESRNPRQNARGRFSIQWIFARAIAASIWSIYHFADWIRRQYMVLDATDENIILEHATLWGVVRKPKVKARGILFFEGDKDTFIPAGTLVQREDDAFKYITLEDVTILGVHIAGHSTIEAVLPGENGNAPTGTRIGLVTPIPGIDEVYLAYNVGGYISGGKEAESIESLKKRVIERIRNRPQCGTKSDYIQCAESITEISRAWVKAYPEIDIPAGSVKVFLLSHQDHFYVEPDVLAAVKEAIEAIQPVTASVTVHNVNIYSFDVRINYVGEPEFNTRDVEKVFEAFTRNEVELGQILTISDLYSIIQRVPNLQRFKIYATSEGNSSAETNYNPSYINTPAGYLPKLRVFSAKHVEFL